MIYKYDSKDYLKSALIAGCLCAICDLIFGGIPFSITSGGKIMPIAISAILIGVFMSVITYLSQVIPMRILEKKSKNLRAEISKVRKIICEGPANHIKGRKTNNGIVGWLFVSEDAIEFYPNKTLNIINKPGIPILLDDISNVETVETARDRLIKQIRLIIHTKKNETFSFIVRNGPWKQSIMEIL